MESTGQKIDSYLTTRLPEYATKVGRILITALVKLYRFIVSLFSEAFNR